MFNLQGSELIIILLLALVVLGPEKLPDAMRKMGQFYAELRKMSNSFQKEFKAAVDEPMREVRETANVLRDSADFRKLQTGARAEKPKSAEMVAPADAATTPTADVPFDAPIVANGEAALEAPFAPPVGRPSLVAPPSPVVASAPMPNGLMPPNALPGRVDGWVPPSGDAIVPPPPPPSPTPSPPPSPPPPSPPPPAQEAAT